LTELAVSEQTSGLDRPAAAVPSSWSSHSTRLRCQDDDRPGLRQLSFCAADRHSSVVHDTQR